jgi:hypothetical protein
MTRGSDEEPIQDTGRRDYHFSSKENTKECLDRIERLHSFILH